MKVDDIHSSQPDAIVGQSAYTRPPAKLNLFLELLARRDDGYHDLETVMVPIDWTDELTVQRKTNKGISLDVRWVPSERVLAQRLMTQRLGMSDPAESVNSILAIPPSPSNLVYKAIEKFQHRFEIAGGFHCVLRKHIPAGAGMGGASSDAASALRCAAKLCGIFEHSKALFEIAASIGSDVPFFLGVEQMPKHQQNRANRLFSAARATGRGERLELIKLGTSLHFVVVFPCRSLSTASVYGRCVIPESPISSDQLVVALQTGDAKHIGECLSNRLAEPAKKIAPVIDEILESMWRSGLQACQLTGSGSACFAIAPSALVARRCASRLQARLQPGALIKIVRSTNVPSTVLIR